MSDASGKRPVTTYPVVAVNSGRLWRESLAHVFADTRFALYEGDGGEGDLSIVAPPLAPPLDLRGAQPTIFLYRDHSATGHCVDWILATRARQRDAKIIVIVSQLRLEIFCRAMQAGADGFLTDDISGAALVQSLELAAAGEKVLPGLLGDFIARQGIHPLFRDEAPDSGLSPRESDILKRLAHGQSNKVIANALGIAESTVKGCVKVILRKIAVQNRTQAAVWALSEGFLLSDDAVVPGQARAGGTR